MTGDPAASERGWRAPILRSFTREIADCSPLTIVADPDGLLTEQGVLEAIKARGFEVIFLDDPIAFRYVYETHYRRLSGQNSGISLVAVARIQKTDINSLPYDVLTKARRGKRVLSFSLGELFPNLSPTVVSSLDRSDFDELFAAEKRAQPGRLGENATKDFILLHLFNATPGAVKNDVELLRQLLERHYRGRPMPADLDSRWVDQLRESGLFRAWPLEQIVPQRSRFFEFLEERWPYFVLAHASTKHASVSEAHGSYGLRYTGPVDLPFDDPTVRAFVDTLFVEGLLKKTDVISKGDLSESWMRFGVAGDPQDDEAERLRRLGDTLRETIPHEHADARLWLEFATRWGELAALQGSVPPDALAPCAAEIAELTECVDERFFSWMSEHYGSLHNRSYLPRPSMLHQIAPYIAHGRDRSSSSTAAAKIAVLVVDGLGISQWIPLRESLKERVPDVLISDGATFAWVPTLTSVSRQTIFAGEPPQFFANSIRTTQREPQHWRRFWGERGVEANGSKYVCQKKQEPEERLLDRILESADDPQCQVLGLVIGIVDQMMHGNPTGMQGLHGQVTHWAMQGHFSKLVQALLDRRFRVYVTSDHGNVEAAGAGKPHAGETAEERGERVYVFERETLRDSIAKQFEGAISWPSVGLPANYLPLIAGGRSAFISKGKRVIAHGGIALEEVVVPFAEIQVS